MNPSPGWTLFALAMALAATGSAQQEAGAVEPVAPIPLEAEIDGYLAPYLATGNFSGSILIARHGTVLFEKGYGFADVEHGVPNTPETVFHLASVSRVFTSAAVLRLEQAGKLDLGDPLAKYLPGFADGERITIRHLLTLSAGFPNINALAGYEEWSLTPQTPASLVARFRDLPLEFVPGERTVHSNSNYSVLALLIETLSGRTFGEYLEEAVFAPLGMTRTAHDGDPSAIVPHRARGYTPAGVAGVVNAPCLDWSVKTGNGSLYSTVRDLYRFDRALARPGFLAAGNLQASFHEHFEHNGFGWFVSERFGDRELYINGRSPGFGAYLGRLETQDLSVIVLGNLYSSLPTDIGRDLMAIVLGEPYAPPAFGSDPLAPDLAEQLAGVYQFGDDFYAPGRRYSFTVENGHLLADGDWLMPAGGLRFIHRIYGSELEFVRADDGRITAVLWDGLRGERAVE